MDPGVWIPLACFAAVVLIVALVCVVRVHDLEVRTYYRLHEDKVHHQQEMERLEAELKRVMQER